jgi:hypothetical protein
MDLVGLHFSSARSKSSGKRFFIVNLIIFLYAGCQTMLYRDHSFETKKAGKMGFDLFEAYEGSSVCPQNMVQFFCPLFPCRQPTLDRSELFC